MKRSLLTAAVLAIVAVAPATVWAQDSSATRQLSGGQAAILRLETALENARRSFNFLDTSTRDPLKADQLRKDALRSRVALNAPSGARADMGVLPGCPIPRMIPDTARIIPMPHAHIDTTIDSRIPRAELRCAARVARK